MAPAIKRNMIQCRMIVFRILQVNNADNSPNLIRSQAGLDCRIDITYTQSPDFNGMKTNAAFVR